MNTADRIGLLPVFGWLADNDLPVTVGLCWLLTPVLYVLVVGRLGESRWIPLDGKRQFKSFFPGDLFLGLTVAALLVLAQYLPAKETWYNSQPWHAAVFFIALMVASVITWLERKGDVYPARAIISPTKIYHNFVLYWGYGYVAVTTLIAVSFGSAWSLDFALKFGVALVPGLFWVWLVKDENSLGKKDVSYKANHAHVEDWKPFWQR